MFIAYSGSIHEEIRPEFRSQPQTMCAGFPGHQTGARYTVPRAYRNTAHPYGQRCVRPPAYYKHQKLLATPGQRTRGVGKSSGVIFQGPMGGSNCIMDHKHRTQFLRTASMKQPTMYSYMAFHQFLYQNVFNTSTLSTTTQPFTPDHHPDEPDLTQL